MTTPMDRINAEPLPTPHDHVIFTDLGGGEGVLVDLNSKQYFQLNETASLIWVGLSKRKPLSDISRDITDVYDVPPDRARASVENAIRGFANRQLLKKTR